MMKQQNDHVPAKLIETWKQKVEDLRRDVDEIGTLTKENDKLKH